MHTKRWLVLILGAAVLAACSGDDQGAGGDGGTHDGMDGGRNGGEGDGGGSGHLDGSTRSDGSTSNGIVRCQGHIYQCGNGIDDDGDGLIDDRDPDCLGPCSNNESGFYLNIPGGDSAPCKLDCYFDQDQGSGGTSGGNDGCRWDHRCDPKEPDWLPACAYQNPPPPSADCPEEQAPVCADFCGPLVPNGCDCFGCCELPAGPGGALEYVFIGSVDESGTPTCRLDNLEGCHPCTPVQNCLNTCERCELCLGRPVDDLPDDCFPSGPPDAGSPVDVCSDPNRQDCGVPGLPECPDGLFCITGCCTYFG